jgi:2-haloacid dehalogenase
VTSRREFWQRLVAAGVAAVVAPRCGRDGSSLEGGRMSRRILVFDVNETLLDVGTLEPRFARLFGDGRVLREWFGNVLLYSNVVTLAGPYADFGTIGGAALDMTASARGVTLSAEARGDILQGMLTLPAHPDVRPGLERLRDAGFRMVTLTNSAPAAVTRQLEQAGLAGFFERAFSVDAVRRFKPAPEPYRHVATELGVAPGQLRMVAAHAWDVHGALQAGLSAVLLTRPGHARFPHGPTPDVVAATLIDAVPLILAAEPA